MVRDSLCISKWSLLKLEDERGRTLMGGGGGEAGVKGRIGRRRGGRRKRSLGVLITKVQNYKL